MNIAFESVSRDVIWPMTYPAPNFNMGLWADAPMCLRLYKYVLTLKGENQETFQVMSSIQVDAGNQLFGRFDDGRVRMYNVVKCEELK